MTGPEDDAFFRFLSSSQGRRLDDQRVALKSLPGISGNSDPQLNGSYAKNGAQVCHATPKLVFVVKMGTTII